MKSVLEEVRSKLMLLERACKMVAEDPEIRGGEPCIRGTRVKVRFDEFGVQLIAHLLVTLARLAKPGGLGSEVAESLAVKHQLLILRRARRRAPYLTSLDQLALGASHAAAQPLLQSQTFSHIVGGNTATLISAQLPHELGFATDRLWSSCIGASATAARRIRQFLTLTDSALAGAPDSARLP